MNPLHAAAGDFFARGGLVEDDIVQAAAVGASVQNDPAWKDAQLQLVMAEETDEDVSPAHSETRAKRHKSAVWAARSGEECLERHVFGAAAEITSCAGVPPEAARMHETHHSCGQCGIEEARRTP